MWCTLSLLIIVTHSVPANRNVRIYTTRRHKNDDDFLPEQFLRHLNDALDPKQTAFSLRVSCQNAGALPAPGEEYQAAATSFRERLLELVREWIESGEDEEFDTDEPMERRLELGTTTQLAIEKCWREHRVIPRVLPTGEVIRTIERSEPVPKDGTRHRPIEVMQGNAVAEFVTLLNSPLRYKLSPCDKCSKYWFRERLRKRYYRDRRFCPECREAATSRLRMQKKRKPRACIVLTAATKAFTKWPYDAV